MMTILWHEEMTWPPHFGPTPLPTLSHDLPLASRCPFITPNSLLYKNIFLKPTNTTDLLECWRIHLSRPDTVGMYSDYIVKFGNTFILY